MASNKEEPVTFTASASIRELTIDDKIREAQLIVIGEVTTTLPSKWRFHNEKETKNASPQEIFDAEGLFTDSIISIEQILKGDLKDPIVRVRSFRGETRQVRWEKPSEPLFKKGHLYLLFLGKDIGPSANVDPGDYVSINSNAAVYEIVDGKAASVNDEWLLEDLIDYIKQSLSNETSPVETPTLITDTSIPTELLTETPLPADTPTFTP